MKNSNARRVVLLALLIIAATTTLPSCSAYQLKGQPGKPVILEADGKNCRVVEKKGLYSLLFGAVPLNPVKPGEFFKQGEAASYRVTDEVTTLDTVISIVAGWALSLNRRTITVEACEENVRVADPEAERKELDRILAGYAQDARSPVIVLKDGQSHQGRIVEFTDTEVALETRPRPDSTDGTDNATETNPSETETKPGESGETPAEPVNYIDVIELKNGQVKKGKITSQNRERIVIQMRDRSEEILKTSIDRVRYRVPETEAEAEPEITVLRIPRENISKIIIR